MSGSAPAGSRFILASGSPRRQSLLRDAGYAFDVIPANIDEDAHPAGLSPAELAAFLASEKARAVARQHPHRLVLAADTVVALGPHVFSKPDDADHARQMLGHLSGTTHEVITGVALLRLNQPFERITTVTSRVHMRPLTPAEIDAYIAGGQWQGKAGGYGIQDNDPFVTRMEGSLSNIVGLPMETVAPLLAQAG